MTELNIGNRSNLSSHFNTTNSYYIPGFETKIIVRLIYVGMILLTGFYGNIICIVKYSIKITKRSKSSGMLAPETGRSLAYFLFSIATADLLVLLILLESWIRSLWPDAAFVYNDVVCKLLTFTSSWGTTTCPWFIAALTSERFAIVKEPLKRHLLVSPNRTRVLILIISAVGMGYNAWLIDATQADRNIYTGEMMCNLKPSYHSLHERYQYCEFVFTGTIPLAIMLLLNFWIVIILTQQRLRYSGSSGSTSQLRVHHQSSQRRHASPYPSPRSVSKVSAVLPDTQNNNNINPETALMVCEPRGTISSLPSPLLPTTNGKEKLSEKPSRRFSRQSTSSVGTRVAWRILSATLLYFIFNLPLYTYRTWLSFRDKTIELGHSPVISQVLYLINVIQYVTNCYAYAQVNSRVKLRSVPSTFNHLRNFAARKSSAGAMNLQNSNFTAPHLTGGRTSC